MDPNSYIILICRYQCIFVPGRDFRQDVTVYWEASWLERGERHLDTPSIIHYMHDELMTYKIEFVERKKRANEANKKRGARCLPPSLLAT